MEHAQQTIRVKKILDDLHYDFNTFTIDHFVSHIEQLKNRKIFLVPWRVPSGWFGVWMSDGEAPREYFFYRDDVPEFHQIHIQLHELAHFLCGHPTTPVTKQLVQAAKAGLGELPYSEHTRLRSPQKSEYEFEAEYLASLIQEQAIRHSQLQSLIGGVSSDEKIAAYIRDLGLI